MEHTLDEVRAVLLARLQELPHKADIFKAPELKQLYGTMSTLPPEERPAFGQQLNQLKQELQAQVEQAMQANKVEVASLDVTAPFDINVPAEARPAFLPTLTGSQHPLMRELSRVIDIFARMGFDAVESRQLDSDWNMFGALNFPEGHPARDGYDTFRTEEDLIPPAHTSTMQHRILRAGKAQLERGEHIASISYGRVFRNEDVDATHEHTFYQVEGVFVSETASLAQMLATLRTFFETYYGQTLKIKTQPAYFPFVEPGLEFAIEKPVILGGGEGEWLEVLGCGMIHPEVLRAADIDPERYRGFAWGGGVERLVMLAQSIEDLRHFESGKLSFLRKFAC